MMLINEIVQNVFRPSVAALSIAVALAVVTIDKSPNTVSRGTINLSELGCQGLLKPVCGGSTF